jgi:hypothetical protein
VQHRIEHIQATADEMGSMWIGNIENCFQGIKQVCWYTTNKQTNKKKKKTNKTKQQTKQTTKQEKKPILTIST